tara:strand:- start:2674 stop:2877 length:204 start_codon:yes stop_codon:yes gene_type:complete
MDEFKRVHKLLAMANDLPDGGAKREVLLLALTHLLDEYIGLSHSAGVSRKHSIKAVIDSLNTGGDDE